MKRIVLILTIMLFTASVAFGAALSEGFETWTPTDWTIVQGPDSPTNDITQSSSQAHGGTYSARFSSYSSASGYDEYLITPQLVTTGGDQTISFWYRKYSSGSEVFKVGWSSTGTNVSTDFTWSAEISDASTTWQQYSKTDLPVGTKYVAIHYYSDYQYYLYIDDVAGPELYVPAYPKPTGLTTTSITTTTADLDWTEAGSATIWDVEWMLTGVAQGSGTTISVITVKPYTLNPPLTANTTYDWYVRSDCGGGNYSDWAGPETFTTAYTPTTVPWTEGFETIAAAGSWPGGWAHDGDWDTYTSSTSYNRQPRTGDNFASCYYNADDWAYTCPITLEASKTYNFSIWYITDGNSGWTTLEAKYGTGQTSGDMTNSICSVSDPTNTNYQELTGSFSPASDGTYYIGIHVEATYSPWYITIDDLSLAETVAKDIAVNSASIALPANVWCYYQGGSYTVSAVIENRGTEADPASVTLTYKEGSEPANEDDGTKQVFTPSWAKGNTATCTFTTQWSPASTGDKTVYVKAFYPGDGNLTNDVASKTVNVKAQYTLLYESFEDTWDSSTPWGPPNWSEATDAAGTTVGNSDWTRTSSYHQEGSYSAYVPFSSYSSDDDWLISPVIDLTANTSKGASQLSYWIRFSTALTLGDFLYVKISVDGGATWSATLKTYDDTNTSGMTSLTWQGIDLAAYSAQSNVKIGFYGDSNANGAPYIYLDVVKIAPESAPTAATNPDPSNTDTNVAISTNLTWDDGGGAASYNVYFGTDTPPTNIVNGTNQAGTTYDPASDLAYSTTHYWRIDAVNAQETTAGSVWSFTTQDNPNYGGGGAGTGGYYFANSTTGASGAPSQPSYSWYPNQTGGANEGILIADTDFTSEDDGHTDLMDIFGDGSYFNFFGNNYLYMYLNSNGTINFTAEEVPTFWHSTSFHDIPSTAGSYHDMIAWCWDDLEYDDNQDPDVNIRISRLSNRTIVTFWHYPIYSGGTANSITAQVIIYKDGRVFIMYNDDESTYDQTTQNCAIGIENIDGTAGVGYRYSQTGGPIFSSNLALAFGTNENTLPVVLSDFTIQINLNSVPMIYWTTNSETDIIGWNIYRSENNNLDQSFRINAELIQGAGTTSQPTDYSFEDVYVIYENTTYWYWLESIEYSGIITIYEPTTLIVPEGGGEPQPPEIPYEYGLHQNYPNPFNPNTVISFVMKEDCIGELSIYNIKGQKVITLFSNKSIPQDELIRTSWNGKDETGKVVSPGIYFMKLLTGNYISTKKIMILK